MAEGDIGAVVDSLEFDAVNCLFSRTLHVTGDIYAIAYYGDGSDLEIVTVNINAAGEIGAGVIDRLTLVAWTTFSLGFIKVAEGVFAIVHSGTTNPCELITISISDAGDIGDPILDILAMPSGLAAAADIVWVLDNIYAIAYTGTDTDGWLATVEIDAMGNISGAAIDSLEFDTTIGLQSSIIRRADGMVAIAYYGPGEDGILITVAINAVGTIAAAVTDTFVFDAGSGTYPRIMKISGDIYAIIYTGLLNAGWLKTISIDAAGEIGAATIDAFEFDGAVGYQPTLVHVSGDVYAIAYSGFEFDGWTATITIDAAGNIGAGTVDTFEFDDANCLNPWIIHISGNVYAISYTGPGDDGWLKTIGIETVVAGGAKHLMMMGMG